MHRMFRSGDVCDFTGWCGVQECDTPGRPGHWRYPLVTSLTIAVWLIPTCFVGSWIGAMLTYVLPLKIVRMVFCVLVSLAAWKFLIS